jgi:protein-disulfide isomerase
VLIEQLLSRGIARFEFRQFPVLGEDSEYAAQVTDCAADQDGFWPLHDRFMANDRTLYTEAGLRRQATANGLDVDLLFACIRAGTHQSAVEDSKAEGQRRGVRATPTVFINDVLVDATAEAIVQAAIQQAAR